MQHGGKSDKKRGTAAQDKQAGEEEEDNGASGVIESTEGEDGKEPTMADLVSILQANMAQQEAREARQKEVTERQEQRFKTLQHQFQLLQLEVQARTSSLQDAVPGNPDLSETESLPSTAKPLGKADFMLPSSGQMSSHHEPRLEKLTDNDDIEHFLITFERMALAYRWQKSDWVFRLIPLLTGRARGAYVHMAINDSLDYNKVKAAILSKFDINPETYRQRFRSTEVNSDESPKELYARLKELYGKWIQPKELQVWIREQDPGSAVEAARLADIFVAAQKKGQPWSYSA
ncbi:uncharacterized protein LOC121640703 [Melanotaenia boesemani]|uniref:uncharacterized protein LOC121640703 n=1 Tax=Melanotaenia boesemani TaxID=1250792 RepID=UPI001C040101|nr:uncharacterized protein LOC121640703 [Melanotaenia boesemani]